uniref:Uncharacterized protein n=1 Tax=Siphoviridae sp. ctamP19 TaxID=2827896 RepID=A0A8S5TNC8_9CAUD|nr:MAG TPA: hypothetical protein [Siphoviridae sp. ctamP19]
MIFSGGSFAKSLNSFITSSYSSIKDITSGDRRFSFKLFILHLV